MSTSVATSQCASCGDPIYGTRFCETCGTRVAVESTAPVVPPVPAGPAAAPAAVTASAHVAEPMAEPIAGHVAAAATVSATRPGPAGVDLGAGEEPSAARVRLGLLLALNGIIWTPIVPVATAFGMGLIGQSIGNWSLQSQMWPIALIAAIIAPSTMTFGFILAARAAVISSRARAWAVVLAVIAGLLSALGASSAGVLFGALSLGVPSLGAYAAIGAWGLISHFRGPGYWAFLYTFVASVLLSAAIVVAFFPVLLVLVIALWVLGVIGVVKLALAHERRAAARPPRPLAARQDMSLAAGRTNGFATASLILALVGGGVLAIVFGHVALSQIRQTGEGGSGMATAGLVIGYVSIVLSVIVTIILGLMISTGAWG